MANATGINVLLAVRQHIHDEIDETREDIALAEGKLEELRAHLGTLLAVRHAAGVPERAPKPRPDIAPAVPVAA